MNVAIYVRVSTDVQAEKGYSIPTQIEACRKKALELGAETIKEYIDNGYSGAYLERPALEELRQALCDCLFQAVVIYDPDRLSRKLSHQLLLTDEVERSGARLVFVSMDFQQTPEGQLFYQIRGAFADFEREKIKERTMRGKRGKMRQGKILGNYKAYGYKLNKQTSQLEIEPTTADIVKRIFNEYISTTHGAQSICDRLNAEGIPSPNGLQWHTSAIYFILKHSIYTGTFYGNSERHVKVGPSKWERSPKPRDEWIPLKAPTIIDKETFDLAQTLIDKKRTYKTWQRRENKYLLQGVLYCGKCGRRMSIVSNNNGRTFYFCRTREADAEICDSRYCRTDILDGLFWEALIKLSLNKKRLAHALKMRNANPIPKNNNEQLLNKIKTERQTIMTWFSQSLITQEQATQKLVQLQRQEKLLQTDTADKPKEKISTDDFIKRLRSVKTDFDSKRNLILSCFEKIYVVRTDNSRSKYEVTFTFEAK